MTTAPAWVSQEVYERVQAKLSINRAFARRNNTSHDYLLRALASCGACGLACSGLCNSQGYRYYSCVGKRPPVYSRRDQQCPSPLVPASQLDQVVWDDLCNLLAHPEQAAGALERAHGGQWLPFPLQARQIGMRKAQASLAQQLDRLTDAYLGGVISLEEYRRRRADTEQRRQAIKEEQQQLSQQVNRRKELSRLSHSIGDSVRACGKAWPRPVSSESGN